MAKRLSKLIALFWLAFVFSTFSVQASPFDGLSGKNKFLSVDSAFAFDFQQSGQKLTLKWDIAPGYYLYQHQIKIEPTGAELAPFTLPQAQTHHDNFYGDTLVYTKALEVPLTLTQSSNDAIVTVTYQGCAEAGFCYPPETRKVPLSALTEGGQRAAPSAAQANLPTGAPQSKTQELPFSPLWALLIGIVAAATPCVLPMYPLISSLILGGKQRMSLKRAFFLAFVYVQGMAVTYTALGIVVAAAGMQFQAYFQHPAVLIGLSALFILLALSMFGVFTLQMPSSVQTRLTEWSNGQKSGSTFGVFVMGALAGLISSPCTTAPLTAILLYIAQSGDLLVGGGTLYLYALGMGLPLILVATFGNQLLPKSGPWMESVKVAFGFVILALPVFLLERVVGDVWGLRMWSALGVAFFAWAFITSLKANAAWARVLQIILLAAAFICARPLQDWAFGAPTASVAPSQSGYAYVSDVDELQQALVQANGRPVMLDLYADWCVTCKELDKKTLSHPDVVQALSRAMLLKADVTANEDRHAQLLKQLNVLGLPSILFFDAQGKEIVDARVTGFMDAQEFKEHLKHYGIAP